MAKSVQLNIRIDKNGKIHATPSGTVGEECIGLLKMLDDINGIVVEECITNEDYDRDVHVINTQNVGH